MRRQELELCLSLNVSTFDGHVRVVSDDAPIPDDCGVPYWVTYPRLQRWSDFVDLSWSGASIIVVANTDIIITRTVLQQAHQYLKDGEVWALLRWELFSGSQAYGGCDYSQDAWIFRDRLPTLSNDVEFSRPGFDNVLAYELQHAGLKVLNPSKSVKIWHHHSSELTTEHNTQKERHPLPYLFVSSHALGDQPVYRYPDRLPKKSFRG